MAPIKQELKELLKPQGLQGLQSQLPLPLAPPHKSFPVERRLARRSRLPDADAEASAEQALLEKLEEAVEVAFC